MTVKPPDSSNVHSISEAKVTLETCVGEVKAWLTSHLLKFNEDKTVIMALSSRHRPQPDIPWLTVGSETIQFNDTGKNIGVVFDSDMTLQPQVDSVVKKTWASLWSIGKIRRYLTEESAKTFIHAYVTSRLDYCNSLLTGLPTTLIHRLQLVQNAAARIITRTRKYDHITPVLRELHWLPVVYRIQFKVLLLVYKALHKEAPQYVVDMLRKRDSERETRSTSVKSPTLIVPMTTSLE